MAAQVVSFEVSVDDQGVVQGFKRIDNAAAAAGNSGTRVFQMMSKQQKEARESAELFSRTLGIELPRSLQKILTKIPAVSGALSKLFSVGAVLGFATAIVAIVNNFDEMEAGIRRAGFQLYLFGARIRGIFGGDMSEVIGERVRKEQGFLAPLLDQVRELNEQAEIANKVGFSAISAKAEKAINDLKRLRGEQVNKATEQFGLGSDGANNVTALSAIQLQKGIAAVEKLTTQERIKYRQQLVDETAKAQHEIDAIGLQGAAQILQVEKSTQEELRKLLQRGVIDRQTYTDRIKQVEERSQKEIFQMLKQDSLDERQLYMHTNELEVEGEAKVLVATRNRINEEMRLFELRYGALESDDYRRQLAEETLQHKIQDIERQGVIERVHIQRQYIEQVGQDFVELWDDLTGGSLGKRILKNVKSLAGQIFAQFALQSRAARGPMSNLLASLIFGPGSQSAGIFSTPGAVGTQAAGGGIGSILGLGGLLGGGAGGGAINTGSIFGGASGTPGIFNFGAGSPFAGGGGSLSGPIVATGSGIAGGGGGSLNSAIGLTLAGGYGKGGLSLKGLGGSLKGAAPLLGLMLGGFLGGKAGGTLGMIGGGITGTVLGAAIMNPYTLVQSTLLGSLAGAAAGGLLGFGVGSQHGGVAGSLSGAGAGALTGLLIGGPVGAIIGGIVGLLGGIFGGLFGGSKRKKAANNFVNQQVEPEIKKLLDQYKGFQLDYASALSGLDQLKSDAEANLKKLKGEGKSIFTKRVIPDIDAARKEIESTEMERQRRQGLYFGPPQFALGGYTGDGARNQTAGIVHAREFVNNADSTAKPNNRKAMEFMNRGGSIESFASGAGRHLHIHTMDAGSFRAFLRNGGAKEIADAFDGMAYEGGA